jgi:hypothetical protein
MELDSDTQQVFQASQNYRDMKAKLNSMANTFKMGILSLQDQMSDVNSRIDYANRAQAEVPDQAKAVYNFQQDIAQAQSELSVLQKKLDDQNKGLNYVLDVNKTLDDSYQSLIDQNPGIQIPSVADVSAQLADDSMIPVAETSPSLIDPANYAPIPPVEDPNQMALTELPPGNAPLVPKKNLMPYLIAGGLLLLLL